MPRTIAVDCPGCPPIRALTFDTLGLIKVIEARPVDGNQGTVSSPKVVERWGDPNPSNCILAASIDDRRIDPLLAVARRSGLIEVINPLNGDIRVSAKSDVGSDDDDSIVGLHLFRREISESSSSRSCTLLTTTAKGTTTLRPLELADSSADSSISDSVKTWRVCSSGDVSCSAVDGNECYALYGGKGVEVNVWDLEKCDKIWTAKSPPKNSLGIFTPTWFTSATFLCKEDHRKIVAGTKNHQVRLYDIASQRRPVISFDFREASIKAVTADLDGNTVYFGTGSGDLASADIRTGLIGSNWSYERKLLGCFIGKCSGSIRSIVRHPELPIIASCGLDSYLRLWDIKTRQLLSAVFLKQHLNVVLVDSNFEDEGRTPAAPEAPSNEEHEVIQNLDGEVEDGNVLLPVKRKKASKDINNQNKNKLKLKPKKKNSKRVQAECDG
ncbi:hypothetical protein Sjap_018281 [Stephania japonica]|uniref:WD repeat-containing protein 74 n=1 Tax=Stephania japonica TaxID=461633 RepID=A0AAP0I8G4_9MAGN